MKSKHKLVRILFIWGVIQFIVVFLMLSVATWHIFFKLKKTTDTELAKSLVNYSLLIADRLTGQFSPGEPLEINLYRNKLDRELDKTCVELGLMNISITDTNGILIYSFDKALNLFEPYPYIIIDKAAFALAKGGVGCDTDLYEKKGKYLKGAFYPIFNQDKTIAGIIHIEAGSDSFNLFQNIRKYAIFFSIIMASALALFILFFIGTLTSLKRAETSVMRSVALSTLGELVSIVAHEIRNPIGIMRAAVDRLEKKLTTPDEKELIFYLKEELERLNDLVKKYLLLSHPVTFTIKQERLSPTINEIVSNLKDEFARSGIKFRCDFTDDPEIEFAPDLLRHALINLFINSKDAMENGGTISISTKIVQRKNKWYLAVEVGDTGKGIPKNELKKVFEPFYTTKKTGTGLGLYIVKRIMEEHKGDIEVSSIEGMGTIFVLYFPLKKGEV